MRRSVDEASPGEAGAPARGSQLRYRGFRIEVSIETHQHATFGHADLYAQDRFLARVSVGSASAAPAEVEQKVKLLAKAKVDTWMVTGSLPSC